MEEKETIKLSLSTFFLIIAIIVIIIMACYMYVEKINSNNEISKLEANANNMQNTIDDLQGKIDSISNTLNFNEVIKNDANKNDTYEDGTNKNNIKNNGTNSNSSNTIKIDGTYELVDSNNLERVSYTFSGETVTYEALDSAKGTYKIVGNKIEITYNVAYNPDGEITDIYPNGQKEELTIVDENILTSQRVINGVTYNGKYVKNN